MELLVRVIVLSIINDLKKFVEVSWTEEWGEQELKSFIKQTETALAHANYKMLNICTDNGGEYLLNT